MSRIKLVRTSATYSRASCKDYDRTLKQTQWNSCDNRTAYAMRRSLLKTIELIAATFVTSIVGIATYQALQLSHGGLSRRSGR